MSVLKSKTSLKKAPKIKAPKKSKPKYLINILMNIKLNGFAKMNDADYPFPYNNVIFCQNAAVSVSAFGRVQEVSRSTC